MNRRQAVAASVRTYARRLRLGDAARKQGPGGVYEVYGMLNVNERAITEWQRKQGDVLEARAFDQRCERVVRDAIFRGFLGLMGIPMPTPGDDHVVVEGVTYRLGEDRQGYALRFTFGCDQCGRYYGEWSLRDWSDLGEQLSSVFQHHCDAVGETVTTAGMTRVPKVDPLNEHHHD